MDNAAHRYSDWKAPSDDGGLLIWPAPAELLRRTFENNQRLAGANVVRIQNVPLPELRRRMRAFLGVSDDAQPFIATGHQAELHHPGVWVKNILINLLAEKTGGQAFHIAVDTDAPKHLALRWPGGSVPLTDDPQGDSDRWSALVQSPTPAHLRRIEEVFTRAAAHWDFKPLVPHFLESLRRLALEPSSLPIALTNALHELDWSLGLRHHALHASPLWMTESFLVFVHHILSRAERFAADYNAALSDYRRTHHIHSPGRPMPDLQVLPHSLEVPFWLDDLSSGGRIRGFVSRRGREWIIQAPAGDAFVLDPSTNGWEAAGALLRWLRGNHLRLSPRALTLTCALRLLAADQFVHGIGGGQYDQVADALTARHFDFDPPSFSVTTATLYFPEAVGRERVCVPCIVREGHRLKHDVLGRQKMPLVAAIAQAPRGSIERAVLFHDLHEKLTAAWRQPIVQQWEQRLRETRQREIEQRALFDRELFYAIQSEERLQGMIQSYRAAMG